MCLGIHNFIARGELQIQHEYKMNKEGKKHNVRTKQFISMNVVYAERPVSKSITGSTKCISSAAEGQWLEEQLDTDKLRELRAGTRTLTTSGTWRPTFCALINIY
jgi:hypothetical protein